MSLFPTHSAQSVIRVASLFIVFERFSHKQHRLTVLFKSLEPLFISLCFTSREADFLNIL